MDCERFVMFLKGGLKKDFIDQNTSVLPFLVGVVQLVEEVREPGMVKELLVSVDTPDYHVDTLFDVLDDVLHSRLPDE